MNELRKNILLCILNMAIMFFSFACRNEPAPAKAKIEKIMFEINSKSIQIGDRTKIGVSISPKEARTSEKIVYSASNSGIIVIDEDNSSNEGVVFEGIGGGNTVITARANGIVDYVDIKVEGSEEAGIPYIEVTSNVFEIPVGIRRNVVATLQEGNYLDNSGFTFSNNNENVILMETVNNLATLEGLKSGSGVIKVSHPKAQYSVDIIVFAVMEGEMARYITAERNVIFMDLGGEDEDFYVRLIGVEDIYSNQTIYEVIERSDVVQIVGSGEYVRLHAKKEGVAKVRVINQHVEYPFEFQVVVKDNTEAKYIEINENLLIIEGLELKNVSARIIGDVSDDYINKYKYELSEEGIINVVQNQNNFSISGIRNGMVVLTISNEYCDFSREILVITQLQAPNIINNENFITTSQNIIQMEIGGKDALLKMKLAGGIEADKNNFEWIVEDSSIIEANTSHGIVSYARSVIDYMDQSSFEAEMLIKAKKVGTTVIRILNNKSINECKVLVKVYPKGTFNDTAIMLGGPSVIKIKTGENLDIYTPIMSGSMSKTGKTYWNIEDTNIAMAYGEGLYGNIEGKRSGVSKLMVSGENLVTPYEAVVVIFNEYEEDSIKYIYTDNMQYRIFEGQTARISIYHPNINNNEFQMSVLNTNRNILYNQNNHDWIIVSGIENGSSELIINVSGANTLRIKFIVESETINIDKPYMLSGESFAGTYEGGYINYKITMAGANAAELSKIAWTIEDSSIAAIENASANEIRIKGLKEGQTILTADHSKSVNSKKLVVYVVKTPAELQQKIVLGLEKVNYVMNVYESLYFRLLTNATENQKRGILWSIDNASIMNIDSNYDSAVITALEGGNCKITVYMENGNHVTPLVLFITIKETYVNTPTIGFPASVVMVKGDSKSIAPNVSGAILRENDLFYDIENSEITSIVNNITEITVKGLSVGQTFINVSGERFGLFKKILVICVATEQDLQSLYYFTVDKSIYRIKKGDDIKVKLQFGENGFPESQKSQIEWQSISNTDVVLINSNGESANIAGKNEGVAKIRIYSPIAAMALELIIEVGEAGFGTDDYIFMYTSINKMVKNSSINIPISIYNRGSLIKEGYSLIEKDVDNINIISTEMAGNILRVTGIMEGKAIIT